MSQLKRSLKRAGIMILGMLILAGCLMGYITYQFNLLHQPQVQMVPANH